MNPAGVLLAIVGLAILLLPGKSLQVFLVGFFEESALSSGGTLFYRVIGGFFLFAGISVAIGP